jgi:hypothetical protein
MLEKKNPCLITHHGLSTEIETISAPKTDRGVLLPDPRKKYPTPKRNSSCNPEKNPKDPENLIALYTTGESTEITTTATPKIDPGFNPREQKILVTYKDICNKNRPGLQSRESKKYSRIAKTYHG